MLRKSLTTLALTAGLLGATAVVTAPAQADPVDDAFLNAVTEAGVVMSDPGSAVAVGQQVCPMLADPSQNAADVAAKVADMGGMSLGPATMFTGIAVSMFCPAMMSSIGNGQSPIPLPFLGI
ncbi:MULTISPECIES: DUF732 domain-containing protein [unclassified Mycobacterium]|uniref:DUF732 domain-containing protein n=1 Tax=unclassified Mycobacterium TaxID=2642494 RepID=UPI0007401CEE|nr:MULTISPECIES: DUF732 domain-containing protein [unclassified Mycobacterium]KUH88812.1 hypothetical protein AU185_03085 [Mycobacterium sp. GA-0227b]KUH91106.1 hypothetical protein AU186_19580 [Mycobacterium sp. GA-1999]KUH95459.1 hypothetical protein AU187_10935 [Mycobacterium sp. IS-1556]